MNSGKLKNVMKQFKVSGAKLGREFGVTRQAVWYWKNKQIPRSWQRTLNEYFTKLAIDREVKED